MTLPFHDCSIQVYQPWGTPSTPPLSRNLTSDTAWESALLRPGAILNLHRQLDRNLDKDATKDYQATSAIRLSYELTFSDGAGVAGQGNAVSDWSDFAGTNSTDYLTPAPDFATFGQALQYQRFDASNQFGIVANTPFIKQNTPFSILLWLYKPPTSPTVAGQKLVQCFLIHFGPFIFMLWNGEPRLGKIAATFTAADFAAWQALQFQVTRSDADQAQLDTLQKKLFDDYKVLDLHHGKDEWWLTPVLLTFIPEPRGAIQIIREGGGSDYFKVSSIATTRRPGILWPDCAPAMSNNFGGLIWQWGYPLFATNGTYTGEQYDFATWALVGQPEWNGLWDCETSTPLAGTISTQVASDHGLPGTEIVFNNATVVPPPTTGNMHELQLTLKASTDRRLTPFLYTLQAFIPAGQRTGYPRTLIYNSTLHTDQGGNPIKEVSPIYEDDQKTLCRRRGCDMTIRDINNALALATTGYATLENCMVDVWGDGYKVLGNGIIKEVQILHVANADGTRKMDTEIKLVISDMWSILEDDAMYDQPIGDGVRLNDYVVTILQGSGAAPAEYAGIINGTGNASSGYRLPQAALGEKPCIRPEFRMKRADFLRTLIEKYGDGHILRCNSGVWTKAAPPTVVGTDPVGSHLWQFSGTGSRNAARTFPGRYVMLEQSDIIKDASDFYNYFRVQGANDRNGNPIVAYLPIPESVDARYKGTSIYLGHWKDYPDTHDTSLRTISDVWTVLRTLKKNHGVSFWFQSFQTYFHPALSVGTMIQADNVIGIVTRISGASAANDRMTVTYMQLHPV
jgi:hypothetical protein